MFEPLSLLVHIVPAVAELGHEKTFDDAVAAQELERDGAAGRQQERGQR